MPPTNEFVTWATGVGANIPATPAAYAAATIRQLGAQIGIADPVTFNNAMRQASVVATMIAQFTADHQSANVNDDGNVATLEAEFLAALEAVIAANLPAPPTGFLGPYYGIDSGSADAIHVTDLSPSITGYVAGQLFLINVAHDNLTTTPTFEINSIGVQTITRADGTPCQPHDIKAGADTLFADTGSGVQLIDAYSTSASVNGVGPYFGADSGAADAIEVTNLAPAITAYKQGQLYLVDVAHNNQTTTPTIQIGSLGQLTITRADGTPCQKNDIQASANTLFSNTGSSAQLLGVYTDSQAISQVIPFLSSTTWTVPAGLYNLKEVELWGAGGAGGGSSGTNASSSGGGGGGYAHAYDVGVTPGQVITVTVGAGGTGGIGANYGSAGGTTTFGSTTPVYATGGGGGSPNAINVPGVGGSGFGAQIELNGEQGGIGSATGTGSGALPVNGAGGGSPFGGGAPNWGVIGPVGAAGLFPGGGSNGGACASGTANGGTGANGFVIIKF
jgi:hypothetical protein